MSVKDGQNNLRRIAKYLDWQAYFLLLVRLGCYYISEISDVVSRITCSVFIERFPLLE